MLSNPGQLAATLLLPPAKMDPHESLRGKELLSLKVEVEPGVQDLESEGRFGIEELFFSATNKKGIIASANAVFARVSGYRLEEMLGKPHNVVRHDDMPRITFKLLWDDVAAGRPFAAYVKNRTRRNRHYWVMALVVPISGGYLSVRLNPSTEHFRVAQGIYSELRALEREIEGPRALGVKPAIAASAERLESSFAKTPYGSYDQFIRTALLAEVRSREEILRKSGVRAMAGAIPDGELKPAIAAISEVNEYLRHLVLNLDEYRQLNVELAAKSSHTRDLADDVRLFALNAIVASSHVTGGEGAVNAVAELLSSRSEVMGPRFVALADVVAEVSTLLSDMLFPVAAASLQAEILEIFLREIAARETTATDKRDLAAVQECFATGLKDLLDILSRLSERCSGLGPQVESLRREMDTMRALSLNGRIESARMEDGQTFTALFDTVAQQVETSKLELEALGRLGQALFTENARDLPRVETAAAHVSAAIAAA